MYENDADRENLRQMLSGLRRDPMDVEEDPDNNDGSFFPCEFCGDPYPSEFIMRHQVRDRFFIKKSTKNYKTKVEFEEKNKERNSFATFAFCILD